MCVHIYISVDINIYIYIDRDIDGWRERELQHLSGLSFWLMI